MANNSAPIIHNPVYYNCAYLGNAFETPESAKHKNFNNNLMNISTASANSTESSGSDGVTNIKHSNKRLRVFKEISMKSVRKNLCNSFNKTCDPKSFNFNCNYQKSFFVESG
jgi:hypothetical protein